MVNVRAARYGRSATHFDDPQKQTVDERVISGRAGHSLGFCSASLWSVVVGSGQW